MTTASISPNSFNARTLSDRAAYSSSAPASSFVMEASLCSRVESSSFTVASVAARSPCKAVSSSRSRATRSGFLEPAIVNFSSMSVLIFGHGRANCKWGQRTRRGIDAGQLLRTYRLLHDNNGHSFLRSTPKSDDSCGRLIAFTRSPAQDTTTESGEPVYDEIVVFEVMTKALNVSWRENYRQFIEREFRQDPISAQLSDAGLEAHLKAPPSFCGTSWVSSQEAPGMAKPGGSGGPALPGFAQVICC